MSIKNDQYHLKVLNWLKNSTPCKKTIINEVLYYKTIKEKDRKKWIGESRLNEMLKWSLYQRSMRTKSIMINHLISSNGKSTVSTVFDVVVVNSIRIAYSRYVSESKSDVTFVFE